MSGTSEEIMSQSDIDALIARMTGGGDATASADSADSAPTDAAPIGAEDGPDER